MYPFSTHRHVSINVYSSPKHTQTHLSSFESSKTLNHPSSSPEFLTPVASSYYAFCHHCAEIIPNRAPVRFREEFDSRNVFNDIYAIPVDRSHLSSISSRSLSGRANDGIIMIMDGVYWAHEDLMSLGSVVHNLFLRAGLTRNSKDILASAHYEVCPMNMK